MLQLLYMICSVKVFSILDKHIPLENYVSSNQGFGMSPRFDSWNRMVICEHCHCQNQRWEHVGAVVENSQRCQITDKLLKRACSRCSCFWRLVVDQILEKTGSFVLRIFLTGFMQRNVWSWKKLQPKGLGDSRHVTQCNTCSLLRKMRARQRWRKQDESDTPTVPLRYKRS